MASSNGNLVIPPFELRRGKGDAPLTEQIADKIGELVAEREAGVRLPSVQQLAKLLGASPVTVSQAYTKLANQGLVTSGVGRGTFVAGRPRTAWPAAPALQDRPEPEAHAGDWEHSVTSYVNLLHCMPTAADREPVRRPGYAYFSTGCPDSALFPIDHWRDAWVSAFPERMIDLQYQPPHGFAPLRSWVAQQVQKQGGRVSLADVMITNGAQEALYLVARTFVAPREAVVTEVPVGVAVYLDVWKSCGAQIIGVATDEYGMQMDVLEQQLERYRPKIICTTPTANSATGIIMPLERRLQLLRLAKHYDCLVVETDAASDMVYDSPPPPTLKALDDSGRVLHIKSFSKTMLPGLRLGAIVAGHTLLGAVLQTKQLIDRFTPYLLQRVLYRYLTGPSADEDTKALRKEYKARRDTFLAAMKRYFPPGVSWIYPAGGYNVWVNLPSPLSARRLHAEALNYRIHLALGGAFYPSNPPDNCIRLTFSETAPAMIDEKVHELGLIMTRLLNGAPEMETPISF